MNFKITLVYKTLNAQAPAYLTDLQYPYEPSRKMTCRLKAYGNVAFCSVVPILWNNIPHTVKTNKTVDSFQVKLKAPFLVSHLHNTTWLLFNQDMRWVTLTLSDFVPRVALGKHHHHHHYYHHYHHHYHFPHYYHFIIFLIMAIIIIDIVTLLSLLLSLS